MQALSLPELFATTPTAGGAISAQDFYPIALVLLSGVLAYVSLQRWSATRKRGLCPVICMLVFVFHPAWTFSHYDRYAWSIVATAAAAACLVAQWLPLEELGSAEEARRKLLSAAGDTRFFAGEPPATPAASVESFQSPAPQPGASDEVQVAFVMGVNLRLLAAVPIWVFAKAQYGWYLRERSHWLGNPEPNWVLGPLYFLTNTSPADDWIGYVLLAVAVPCILSVLVWPNRWTALVASLTAWAWVIPGTVKALMDPGQ
jgi:hypothetical protein